LRDVGSEAAALDVMRTLFVAAEVLSDRRLERVYLSFNGERRFYLEGRYFEELGRTYSYENPVILIRMLPEHVFELSGERAYQSWSGGWLGVMTRQMEDVNDFHDRWYREKLTSTYGGR
jgi:hypothetical protein